MIDEQGVVEALQGWRIDLPILTVAAMAQSTHWHYLIIRNVGHHALVMWL